MTQSCPSFTTTTATTIRWIGEWIGRDKIVLTTQYNLYTITSNNTIYYIDHLGLYVVLCFAYKEGIIMVYRRKKAHPNKKIIESAISISYACTSATRPKTGGDSFTTVWKGYFGSLLYGVNGRLKYDIPTQVVPSKNPNDYGEIPRWIPEEPNHD